jgi:hypothetical protein
MANSMLLEILNFLHSFEFTQHLLEIFSSRPISRINTLGAWQAQAALPLRNDDKIQ